MEFGADLPEEAGEKAVLKGVIVDEKHACGGDADGAGADVEHGDVDGLIEFDADFVHGAGSLQVSAADDTAFDELDLVEFAEESQTDAAAGIDEVPEEHGDAFAADVPGLRFVVDGVGVGRGEFDADIACPVCMSFGASYFAAAGGGAGIETIEYFLEGMIVFADVSCSFVAHGWANLRARMVAGHRARTVAGQCSGACGPIAPTGLRGIERIEKGR